MVVEFNIQLRKRLKEMNKGIIDYKFLKFKKKRLCDAHVKLKIQAPKNANSRTHPHGMQNAIHKIIHLTNAPPSHFVGICSNV